MKEINYSFSLGRIAVLEEKIIPRSLLEELLTLNLGDALYRVRDYLFSPVHIESIWAWEEKIEEEREILKSVCSELVQEELKNFFQIIDDPLSLVNTFFKHNFLEEFKDFYLSMLNTSNFLRIKFYGLKEEYLAKKRYAQLISDLEKKEPFTPLESRDIKDFYLEAEGILKKEENYLLIFLIDKYLIQFWEKRKRLLGPEIIFWYFFAKKVNLGVLNFLMECVAYSLDKEKTRKVINLIYG
jgi:hypothetical protein